MNSLSNMPNSPRGPILITGASGFVGANVARRLVRDGADVHLFLRETSKTWRIDDLLPQTTVHRVSLTDRKSVFECVSRIKPKTIFHLAAYGAYSYQADVERIEATNLHGTMNLVDACVENGFESFVHTGSSSEYGFKHDAMKEDDWLEPNSYYAVFKAAATQYCRYVATSKQLPIMIARLFSVYGPYEEPGRLIPTLLTLLSRRECPPLVSPETARDYIYIDDVVDAYMVLAQNKHLCGEIFNIGSGKQTALKEIVDLAIELTGAGIVPNWGTMEQRIWDQNTWRAEMSKTRSVLKWTPRIGLKEGLASTADWLKNHQVFYEKHRG